MMGSDRRLGHGGRPPSNNSCYNGALSSKEVSGLVERIVINPHEHCLFDLAIYIVIFSAVFGMASKAWSELYADSLQT